MAVRNVEGMTAVNGEVADAFVRTDHLYRFPDAGQGFAIGHAVLGFDLHLVARPDAKDELSACPENWANRDVSATEVKPCSDRRGPRLTAPAIHHQSRRGGEDNCQRWCEQGYRCRRGDPGRGHHRRGTFVVNSSNLWGFGLLSSVHCNRSGHCVLRSGAWECGEPGFKATGTESS